MTVLFDLVHESTHSNVMNRRSAVAAVSAAPSGETNNHTGWNRFNEAELSLRTFWCIF